MLLFPTFFFSKAHPLRPSPYNRERQLGDREHGARLRNRGAHRVRVHFRLQGGERVAGNGARMPGLWVLEREPA